MRLVDSHWLGCPFLRPMGSHPKVMEYPLVTRAHLVRLVHHAATVCLLTLDLLLDPANLLLDLLLSMVALEP